MPEYVRPGWFSRSVINLVPALAARLGVSMGGAWLLTVNGRKTGEPHSLPVNPLTLGAARYLVSPRGDTQWARNLRAAGHADLRLGRKTVRVSVTEVAETERPAIIAEYLKRWGNVTRSHFGTVKDPDAAELARLAARTPVFRAE
ncbi:MAG: nitroreductase family deazaflavin-dependent oxidoreductase [Dehalococcoidia bacterium]